MHMINEAKAIQDIMVADRRYLHQIPEVGLDLPKTAEYVEKKLREMGYEPQRMGKCGLVATIGKEGGKCFLLRADMDALPVREESGVEFASANGNMHACGHDLHTASLLGAARLLKAHESELEGMVKLMFQPAEESMDGAKMMVEAGICQGVDGALALHVFSGIPLDPGGVSLYGADSIMGGVDWFEIKIRGTGCHGASPNNGVDPLNVMTHIHLALQAIHAREMNPMDHLVLTICQMHGGHTSNVIPEEAYMSGTIRTLNEKTRAMVMERMEAIVTTVAASFRAKAELIWGSGCPVLQFHDKEFYQELRESIKGMEGLPGILDPDDTGKPSISMGSEDFAYVTERVSSMFIGVAAGDPVDGVRYGQHHPKVRFHEDAMPTCAAVYAHSAMEWLKNHR